MSLQGPDAMTTSWSLIRESTKQQYQTSSTQNSPYRIEAAIQADDSWPVKQIIQEELSYQHFYNNLYSTNNPHCDQLMAWKPVGMCLVPHNDTPT